MNDETSRLEPAFEELRDHAVREKVDIDPSFFTELKNYSRHEVVRELPHVDLHRALVGLGRMAIGRGGARVGAGAVRMVITELCNDPFSACNRAAARILEGHSIELGGKSYAVCAPELPTDPFSGSQ